MKNCIFIILLASIQIQAQINDSIAKMERTVKVNDPFYREDQFYIGLSHAIYTSTPQNFKSNGLSIGIQAGALRDIPLNKQRNWAVAPGVGLGIYNMRTNLIVMNPNEKYYRIDSEYDKNKQTDFWVEVPLEVRWRSSNRYSHKFWRIYTGVKYSQLIGFKSVYQGKLGNVSHQKDSNLNRTQIGTYVVAGYNTWNFMAYYGFIPKYKTQTLSDNKNINSFNVGLMFYIL